MAAGIEIERFGDSVALLLRDEALIQEFKTDLHAYYNVNQEFQHFPGCQPVSLMRENLPQLVAHADDYYVTKKTNGTRYLLVLTSRNRYQEQYQLLINRKYEIRLVKLEAPLILYDCTILDGELIQEPDGSHVFHVFDIVASSGINTRYYPLSSRLIILKYLVPQIKRCAESPFELRTKPFVPVQRLCHFIRDEGLDYLRHGTCLAIRGPNDDDDEKPQPTESKVLPRSERHVRIHNTSGADRQYAVAQSNGPFTRMVTVANGEYSAFFQVPPDDQLLVTVAGDAFHHPVHGASAYVTLQELPSSVQRAWLQHAAASAPAGGDPVDSTCSAIHAHPTAVAAAALRWPCDGLVFIRDRRHVTIGTDHELFKWKPVHTNDFYFSIQDNASYLVDLYVFHESGPHLFATQNILSALTPFDDDPTLQVFAGGRYELHNQVVECAFCHKSGLWKPLCIRPDKRFPNHLQVAEATAQAVKENITLNELCGLLSPACS